MRDLMSVFDAHLHRCGYSLSEAARQIPWDLGNLSAVRRGRKPLSVNLAAGLDRLCGTAAFTAWLTGPPVIAETVLRDAHRWLVGLDTAPLPVHRASGRRVGRSTVEVLDRRISDLRRADDTVPARRLAPVVAAETRDLRALLDDAAYTEATGRDLLRLYGEFSQMAGWLAADLGVRNRAEQYYLDGAAAASAAGNRGLAAQLYSCLAYMVTSAGGDGLLLAQTALMGAAESPPLVRALLGERVAWAAARNGERDAAHRALDAVDDAYESRAGYPAPAWTYWLDRTEINVMAARVHLALGAPDRAAPLLEAAIATYPVEHVREVGLYRTWLAEGYARTGDRDAARAVLAAIGPAAGSARVAHRMSEVEQLLHTA
ncbi:hypothetical protein LO763_22320 [Glycomyces sp. A-F 0318]|uniref:hypothetical protein n=1 Tax=Glycomyces amatae TaxID=2881355 RepID=UPI001E59E3D7|nr:hypothetical protein [Glycomyces amatae]MCD0446354.1 hypothetical protein [Glycomyces amatae]